MAGADAGLQPVEPSPVLKTNLDLVNECDSFPYPDTAPEAYTSHISTYFHLYIPPCPQPLGYLLPSVALTLQGIPGWVINERERTLTMDTSKLPTPREEPASTTLHDAGEGAADAEELTDAAMEEATDRADAPEGPDEDSSLPQPSMLEAVRTQLMARTTHAWRTIGHFRILDKWRDELYPIFWKNPATSTKELLCSVERSAASLFGIVQYGCHMTAYTGSGKDMKLYVPRRAGTKQTYPGLLDQTVAGGIATGETAFESMVRESEEEASLPPELTRRKAVACGCVTYFYIRDSRAGGETRLLQPECQFVYDLDLTGENVEPKSGDTEEVEGFEVLTVQEVRAALARTEFKPNCALVVLDFLIRHGILTRENEKDYMEICWRLKRRLEFPCL